MTNIASEDALAFDCNGDSLVGILHRPAPEVSGTGVLIIVGGPQYRVGSHRQFTLLARALTAAGYPVLRFDCRGMGDSSGAQRSFEETCDDIGAALCAGQQRMPQVRHWVLWGLCDGASAALLYWHATRDARVLGLCLVNPWVRTQEGLAITHVKHYYLQRLIQRDFWSKLLSGRVARRAVSDLACNLRMAAGKAGNRPDMRADRPTAATLPFHSRMAQAWSQFDGPILLLLSGEDYTAREFIEHTRRPDWQPAMSRPNLNRVDLDGANHTFSSVEDRRRAESSTLTWLLRWAPVQASTM